MRCIATVTSKDKHDLGKSRQCYNEALSGSKHCYQHKLNKPPNKKHVKRKPYHYNNPYGLSR